ncbi:hypothetical protein CLF_111337, partial [Clonorchis sinensis]
MALFGYRCQTRIGTHEWEDFVRHDAMKQPSSTPVRCPGDLSTISFSGIVTSNRTAYPSVPFLRVLMMALRNRKTSDVAGCQLLITPIRDTNVDVRRGQRSVKPQPVDRSFDTQMGTERKKSPFPTSGGWKKLVKLQSDHIYRNLLVTYRLTTALQDDNSDRYDILIFVVTWLMTSTGILSYRRIVASQSFRCDTDENQRLFLKKPSNERSGLYKMEINEVFGVSDHTLCEAKTMKMIFRSETAIFSSENTLGGRMVKGQRSWTKPQIFRTVQRQLYSKVAFLSVPLNVLRCFPCLESPSRKAKPILRVSMEWHSERYMKQYPRQEVVSQIITELLRMVIFSLRSSNYLLTTYVDYVDVMLNLQLSACVRLRTAVGTMITCVRQFKSKNSTSSSDPFDCKTLPSTPAVDKVQRNRIGGNYRLIQLITQRRHVMSHLITIGLYTVMYLTLRFTFGLYFFTQHAVL